MYAFAAWWLGPGSMLMHGTNTEWGGWADNLSMIMYIIFPWLYNISLMAKWSLSKFINIYVLIVVVYSVVRWFTSWDLGIGFNLFGTSIGLWVISEFLYKFWSRLIGSYQDLLVLQFYFFLEQLSLISPPIHMIIGGHCCFGFQDCYPSINQEV